MFNSISMTQFAATMSNVMGIDPPKEADRGIQMVESFVWRNFNGPAEKVFIYNPDAIGMWLFQKYTEKFQTVSEHVQLTIPVKTVMPSVTPVCFGTMYTGVLPKIHGIQKYEKKQVTTDSFFDALIREGKKVALVAVEDSSMAVIFGDKAIDYYIMPSDETVIEKAVTLIKEKKYDVIIAYNQEYDDMIHETWPESDKALQALDHHIEAFGKLAETVKQAWNDSNALIVWATDHGIHREADGHGDHGDYIEDDMNMMHFYGAYHKKTL